MTVTSICASYLLFQECRCTIIVYLSQEGSYPLFGLTLTGKWATVLYKHWLTDDLFLTFTLWCLCTVLDNLSYPIQKTEVETAYYSSRRQGPALFLSSCASSVAYKLYILSMTNAWRSLGMKVVYKRPPYRSGTTCVATSLLPPPHVDN